MDSVYQGTEGVGKVGSDTTSTPTRHKHSHQQLIITRRLHAHCSLQDWLVHTYDNANSLSAVR
jgi:hypothetical protein